MPLRFSIEPVSDSQPGRHRQAERDAVRRIVDRLLGSEVAVSHLDNGAPQVPGTHISVSHCRTFAAVAVCDETPVGIDIEEVKRCVARIVNRVAHPDDDTSLTPAQLWCAKEAVFKAAGIDDLVLAEVAVSQESATARGRHFSLEFPPAPEGICIALATAQ